MVFEKLASKLTKHYKLVIVIWIIALIASVPAIMQVDSVVKYQSSLAANDEYESMQAQEIIAQNFQTTVANGTLIIVLQDGNMTTAEARDFVLALQQRINSSTELMYYQGTSSVYTYSQQYIGQVIMQLGPAMRPAEQNVTSMAFIMWGLPAMHAANWTESGSDAQAYANTSAALSAFLAQSNADQNTSAFAFGYYNAFAAAWNATAIPDPNVRATTSVNAVAPQFIASLPPGSAQAEMMQAVVTNFNLTTYNDPVYIHMFTLNMVGVMASINDMAFLQAVYDLGPSYEQTEADALASSIVTTETLYAYPVPIPEPLVSNFVSPSNQTMIMMVEFTVTADYVEEGGIRPLPDDVTILRGIISDLKTSTGSQIATYVTGDAAISADIEASAMADTTTIEPVTIIIIIVLMGVLFRTVLGQFLPLAAVGVAIGISQALVFVIGSTVATIDYTVTTMLFAVLMGVGTDYSIFIISRYREERVKGAEREQAVHTSMTWAGESIVTSGATVIIAFFAMALAELSFMKTMGLLMGLAIVVALLVALTLIPAILMLVGNRIFWPTSGKRFERYSQKVMQRKGRGHHGYFHKAATFATKHAWTVILVAVVVSIPTTYIFVTEPTSFDFIGSMSSTESVDGLNAMTEDFGGGKITPTQVVITGDTLVWDGTTFNYDYLDAVDNVTAAMAGDSMVQQVSGVTRPYGQWVDYRNMSSMPLETQAYLTAGMLQYVGSDNQSVLISTVLKDEPQSSAAVGFMPTLRDELTAVQAQQPALTTSTILVGGSTAVLYDVSVDTSQQFTQIELIVIVGIFLVLMIVLGSLLLPLFAIVSIAMSITWAFALTYLVFGTLLGEPILWMIPLILFVMLMGIGMDYNVFILTRIREEAAKGKETRQAVIDAVDWTGGIITALALIMAGAFGSIMLSSNAMLQEFGFALFVAVLLDAMVVRTYIVPAAVVLMGKWAWWAPGRLQRVGRKDKKAKSEKAETE